ncbi:protein SABRE [Punica granatum]|uniref:Protein SABRE n=4 Tax=Punica granatum TaxID=22663 RepID=A0A6P8DMD5_PUNGR|nr:protein SABRE [Punica granatum]
MAASSAAKFLFGFLLLSIVLWLLFIFASRLVAWALSRVVGASVAFRVGGWKCLQNIVVKFKKGPIESVSVGEIKVSLRQSLVKLGAGFLSRDPKLQILICDLEIIMRSSSTSKQKAKKSKRSKGSSGRGKWMVVANVARFLSVSITDLAVKTPKATVEVKELSVDISKEGGSKPNVIVKLQILPIIIHLGEPRLSCDQPPGFDNEGYHFSNLTSSALLERSSASSAPFICEELHLSCEFGHDREAGICIKNVEIQCGEVTVNLNETMLSKSKSSSTVPSQTDTVHIVDSVAAKKPNKKEAAVAALAKKAPMIPEQVSFSLPKLDVKFVHREHNLSLENRIMGIQLRCTKSRSTEDLGESTRLDVQMDFSEIHLLRESSTSVLEILKVDILSLVYLPIEPTSPVRAEVDIKLGGTQCKVLLGRLKPLLDIQSSKKKKMVLRDGSATSVKSSPSEPKIIMWTCTVSAPEMTIVLYSITNVPLYHGCSQSSHLFANNVSNTGTAVHMELGELNLYVEDEYQECLKENLFGVEANSGALMNVAKVSLDWGKKEVEPTEADASRSKLALSVDVTGMGVSFSFKRVETLVSTALSFKALLKSLAASKKKSTESHGPRPPSSGKGTRLIKFNLERCSVCFCGEAGLETSTIADPKRVNYGSHSGRIVFSECPDGTPRTATIMSTVGDGKNLKYSVCLDIFHFSVCLNKDKQSTQMELERARTVYEELLEDNQSSCAKVTLLDMQNSKFVRRAGGHKEISVCSLFSATDIAVRWEPDVHLALVDIGLRVKSLMQKQKLQQPEDVSGAGNIDKSKEVSMEPGQSAKSKKKESIFAVDIEMLTISAEAGDGVEALVQVHSIFSENARIGVLLEGLMLSFNGARIFKSSRMQVSRIPSVSTDSSDAKSPGVTTWDWVIQGLDVHICMPFRLELRAIDDAVEDMLRALKLIVAAKTKLLFPSKTESSKPKKPSSVKLGCVKFCIRKLTADIEEEPIQGWLDERYRLMKNEACELAVRSKYLDELAKGNLRPRGADVSDGSLERKLSFDGLEIDAQDPSSIRKIEEELYRRSFRSYFQACQNLKLSEGSGACRTGFQAGFKFSASRTSLFSISATELDLTLTSIEGGDTGKIEVLKKLDPVCGENNIPFARLYGSNLLLRTGSLTVQIRDYTYPLLSATLGRCEGRLIMAQQATPFQPQMQQDVYVGRWRKVRMFRSLTGTTPPVKTFTDLPIYFQKGEVSFGVGYEPSFADLSYAFTVALRRANLSVRNPKGMVLPPKKEKSLPWWDEMRNYMHGNISLFFSETRWHILGTTDPYEKLDKLQVISNYMEIQQSDGRVYVSAKDFKIYLSSLESLGKNRSLKVPASMSYPFVATPSFTVEVLMDWECASGTPLNHYLFALPNEGKPREKVFDPFRSTSLSLRWNFSLRPVLPSEKHYSSGIGDAAIDQTVMGSQKPEDVLSASPTFNVGAHDLAWLIKFWNLNYLPPHKLRAFSRFPRFGIPRVPRSGNLSLDRVMTEFMLRIDATPTCIKHVSLFDDDPAKGLTFKMTKVKHEMCFSRGKQKFTFECKREPLDLVYQGLDLHMPKAFLDKEAEARGDMPKIGSMAGKASHSALMDRVPSEKGNYASSSKEKCADDGFLLSSDYFTIRRQAPKADPARLIAWQEAGRKNPEMTYVRSEFENGSESDDHARSDQSDDDGYNVVIADNCQRVFVYGLKLLWNIENRDAVWSWVGGLSKAFEPAKPSPSRVYAQRKLHQETPSDDGAEIPQNDANKASSPSQPPESSGSLSSPSQAVKVEKSVSAAISSPSHPVKMENAASAAVSSPSDTAKMEAAFAAIGRNGSNNDSEEKEGTRHFMVNVYEPQFNLHSEEANGRFLLAAVSGRVLARSFHSVLHVGLDMIEQALGSETPNIRECQPEMTWKRMELSVMLERVQAHVAPTDVDPGAGLQWLPKIHKNSAKVKRTGALLERVFMPCDMYFRYTRHKGGTPDLKMKPLKELTFNSHDITATMTSRQFQVMLDVLTNLLFARLPKPRKSSLTYPVDDDEDVGEEADEVVPDGVEEVELAKINLEKKEREQKVIIDDIRKLSHCCDTSSDPNREEGDLWMINSGTAALVQGLKRELVNAQKSRKAASSELRMALQKAAQLRLMEKEKNKSPSYAMRISLQITKVVWGMLIDGKSFAEAEINDMIYDFDRDYRDVGVALFTTKYFVVRNCLPNAKSDMLLSAWNPPPEWGKKVMLRVDAKQGAPKDGHSPLELFQVEIYPLKIHLTETMYRMMWEYFFPEEEQDSQRRQEVWKVSTTAGSKRVKKGSSIHEASTSLGLSIRESDIPDSLQASKLPKFVEGTTPELRRTSSFDRTWEETVAESVANELVLQSMTSGKSGPLGSVEQQDESSKKKDFRPKSGRSSHEEKKVGKSNEEKKTRPRKLMEFHNIKISQVELLVTYEGSRFVVNDLKLLMDTFHRVEFTGTWRRLFSRVKKHIIWGVLKSVTGMQGKKFKDKAHSHKEQNVTSVPDSELMLSDNEGSGLGGEKNDQNPLTWPKRTGDVAGDGFVTSIRGLFNTQRRKATKFVLRTMRGEENDDRDWSESDVEYSPFARQLTITKAKRLIRRHTKKFRSRQKGGSSSQGRDSLPSSPRETTPFESDSSSGSSPTYEDFHEV